MIETMTIDRETALVAASEPSALIWRVAPGDDERASVWLRCRDLWLAAIERRAKGSTATRRAYEHDYNQFFGFFDTWRTPTGAGEVIVGLQPWMVGGAHVQMWIEHLYGRGNSDSTVNRKLAALSSFYNFASYKFTVNTPDGERALWPAPNPFKIPDRAPVDPYVHAVFPEPESVLAILRTIASDKRAEPVLRYRNLALIGGLFFTTRRVSEWVGLRWGDLHDVETKPWFTYRYKGGKPKRQRLPGLVWTWIVEYLKADGRWGALTADDFVFIAEGDSAKRLRPRPGRGGGQVAADYDPAKQPLSAARVNDLLKRYGKRAGVPAEQCHAHGLRHAGALARLDDGAPVTEIRDTLGHGNVAVTQIYIERALSKPQDARGDRLAEKAGAQLKLL
jgi:site-specific recombinase XerD